jgi:hypothetical protein
MENQTQYKTGYYRSYENTVYKVLDSGQMISYSDWRHAQEIKTHQNTDLFDYFPEKNVPLSEITEAEFLEIKWRVIRKMQEGGAI